MNNKFTRIICVLLSLILIFSLTGCGGTEDVWSEWIETVEVPDDSSSSEEAVSSEEDTTTEDSKATDGTVNSVVTNTDKQSSEKSSSNKSSSSKKESSKSSSSEKVTSKPTSSALVSSNLVSSEIASDKASVLSENNSTVSSNSSETSEKNEINITVDGKTRYKITVSLSNEGYDQGRLVQKVIRATAKASVPLILDTETNDGPEIIIGDTTREQSKKLMEKLKDNEYAIESYEDGNIVIVGSNEYSLQMATDKFLKQYFGYDANATQVGKEAPVPSNLKIHQSIFDDYKLAWSDEFEGTTVDTDKWCFKPLMAAQEHLKLYSDERAVQQKDGYMNLIAGRIDDENYWTNTALTTADTMVFKYGYVEMRAKVPFGKPAFPSFWMQSSMYEAADPYVMAEVDMFEHFAQHGDDYLQTGCHKWYRDGSGEHYVGPQIGSYRFGSEAVAEDWHTYGMLWTPSALYFMIDGSVYHTIDITDNGDFGERNDGMGAFHDYAHLIFNNYVNTNKGGSTDNNEFNATPDDEFPITYTIDYVRIYQLPGQGGILNVKDMVN